MRTRVPGSAACTAPARAPAVLSWPAPVLAVSSSTVAGVHCAERRYLSTRLPSPVRLQPDTEQFTTCARSPSVYLRHGRIWATRYALHSKHRTVTLLWRRPET